MTDFESLIERVVSREGLNWQNAASGTGRSGNDTYRLVLKSGAITVRPWHDDFDTFWYTAQLLDADGDIVDELEGSWHEGSRSDSFDLLERLYLNARRAARGASKVVASMLSELDED